MAFAQDQVSPGKLVQNPGRRCLFYAKQRGKFRLAAVTFLPQSSEVDILRHAEVVFDQQSLQVLSIKMRGKTKGRAKAAFV
jgi:hypothetical protein